MPASVKPTPVSRPLRSDESLSIVVPAYNEHRRIGDSLARIAAYCDAQPAFIEVIVVDDGSTDKTAALARERCARDAQRFRLLTNDDNFGKGYSVRRGMLAAGGSLLLMCDADLSTPIEELEKLLPWTDQGYPLVIGSRDAAGAHLDPPQPLPRRLAAWSFRALRRRLLVPHLRDTQCGFKLFTRAAARELFSRQQENGFAFDCELLGLAELLGYRVAEIGVTWRDHPASSVRPWRDGWEALRSLFRIRRRLARLREARQVP